MTVEALGSGGYLISRRDFGFSSGRARFQSRHNCRKNQNGLQRLRIYFRGCRTGWGPPHWVLGDEVNPKQGFNLTGAIVPTIILKPTRIESAGNKPKIIEEFVGRVNSQATALSVARMKSPSGWVEPGQTPEFEEYTVVLKGMLRVTYKNGTLDVNAGQAVVTHPGEWVQYSTPEGAEYIAICLPAFSPGSVHRDS
jgi:mannose-6-phosphate isomerase-like protein (cupin superfamily)